MKKNKQKGQDKAQLKANRKKAEKAIKTALMAELTTLISTFAEPNKKLKKLIEKAATTFSKEIEKTAKSVTVAHEVKNQKAPTTTTVQKVTKPRTVKKAEKEATK